MQTLVYICHKNHLVSGSNQFLVKLLSQTYDVKVVAYDVGMTYVSILAKNPNYKNFLLFQTEGLAPWLVSLGKTVTVFPMYDGCANASASYFRVLDDAYIFNFALSIHKKVVASGSSSMRLRYYPESKLKSETEGKENRAFVWLRRPGSAINEKRIKFHFSKYVDKLHFHDRPDDYDLSIHTAIDEDPFVKTSGWFDKKNDLINLVANSKYFIAPRESEGIGMGFLEAMAAGCIVFANNKPTHNEYIFDGFNGFLIDFDTADEETIRKQLKRAFKVLESGVDIGGNAKAFIESGGDYWNHDLSKLKSVLEHIYQGYKPRKYGIVEKLFGKYLAHLWFTNQQRYQLVCRMAEDFYFFVPTTRRIRFFKQLLKALKLKRD